MGNCNPKALFVIATLTAFFGEFCFIPVLVQPPKHPPSDKEQFCWSWDLTSDAAKNNGRCPFLVLFLAAIINGLLLLITGLYLAFRLCGTLDNLYGRVICKFTLKYGTLAANAITLVLSLLFVSLIIAFTYASKDKVFHYTGGLIQGDQDSHYRFILVFVGTLLSLIGTVLSALLCCRYARPVSEEFTEGGMFRTFTDYSGPMSYDQIN